MEALQALIPAVLTVSLALLIVAVGLDAELDELTSAFRQPGRLVRAVLAVNVAVPLAAVAVVQFLPLSPIAKAGILLMAVSPVPPLVPGKGIKVGASKASAYGVYAALILLAIVIVPVTVVLLGRAYGVDVVLPPAVVARNVALTVLAPLVLGLAVRRLAPRFAAQAVAPLRIVGVILVFAAFVPMMIGVWPVMMELIGNGTILAMALVSAVALAVGHLLGGPALEDRAGLAMTAATRHPGIAMMIVSLNQADRRIVAAILGFLLVGLVVALPYQLWLKRQTPAAAT
ncbi:hypothetical protein [Phenylobacterium sp. J367]|uniref:hypothetical protein n=1 Tax=Phenylobacterium sp. J367 TaxID=2898435 RepID=UPI00215074C7|nr:hypothetical protein [Phenylobacterium sp. J367]MCR5877185.1 hypothetical protein [Phenylobacterium sp. J367]